MPVPQELLERSTIYYTNKVRLRGRKIESLNYSFFQVCEVHKKGKDTAVPCPYGVVECTS
ncbi:MAG: hypothetical protein HC789_07060 [Microcoleus sp. CSU_2_2]|nr:hypothetical protein [Microcoleus sp. CSU_2_2]